MAGRGRGRARGRARGGTEETAPRRPGEQQQQQEGNGRPSPPPPSEGASGGPPPGFPQAPPAAGRASRRGNARGEPRPGAPQEPPTEEMSRMQVSSRGAGRGAERPRFQRDNLTGEIIERGNTRPDHITDCRGTSGQPVQLSTNYFHLQSRPDWILYQYTVDFKPNLEHKGERIRYVRDQCESLLGHTIAFDGMVLFCPRRLQENPTTITIKRNPPNDDQMVQMIITLREELSSMSPTCLQVYNIIFKRCLKMMNYKLMGRHYFTQDRNAIIQVPQHRLQVMPGFATAIGQYEKHVLLNADVAHRLLRSVSVYEEMDNIYNSVPPERFESEVKQRLTGEIVITKYNNKTYRIDDVDFSKKPRDTFETKRGPCSYIEYYKNCHHIEIRNADQPLLLSRPTEKDRKAGQIGDIYLVPEICSLTGLTDDMRKNFTLMKDIAQHTRVDPNNRVRSLENNLIGSLHRNADVKREMDGWGLRFAERLLNLGGRRLPTETLFQLQGQYSYEAQTADWSRNMRDKQFISTAHLNSDWLIIHSNRDTNVVNEFVQSLCRAAQGCRMRIDHPERAVIPNDSVNTVVNALRQNVSSRFQLVMIVVSNNREDRYSAIKQFCCVENPIASQVVISKTISKPKGLMSVATKIMYQLNCKLGGSLWNVQIPMTKAMIVGIDTYHKRGKKSVGAFVTMNHAGTNYYSRATIQQSKEELHAQLYPLMTAALKQWHQIHNEPPKQVIVYRDGVGDGQLGVVIDSEVPQLRKAIMDLFPENTPKFAEIVVKKRINTRFFEAGRGNYQNPLPGTVIDTDVTRPDRFDFYLVSQSVRQGTVTPTHFNVIFDTTGLKPDHIQRLSYKLTHMYYNWPGTIRVPAPCQYAHKLAYLVGQCLNREPDMSLCDRLFYL